MILKQSTSVVIPFGPFVDATDGVTAETGLISAIDHASTGIVLSKNGGAHAVRHATVTASTHLGGGVYAVTLDATDTGTLGSIRVFFADAATCLPVWADFQVVPAEVYDAIVSGSGGGVRADLRNIGGSAVSTSSAQIGANIVNAGGTAWGSGAITAASIADDAITAAKIASDVTAEVQSGLATSSSIAALNNLSAAQVNAEVDAALADINLDHLMAVAVTNSDVANNSALAKLASKSATAAWSTFSNLTDSMEAQTDQLALITPISNTPDSANLTAGVVVSGTVSDAATDDNAYYILRPDIAVGGLGLDVDLTFACGAGRAPTSMSLNGYWNGSGAVNVWAYDYVAGAWYQLSNTSTSLASRSNDTNYSYALSREHMDTDGTVKLRFTATSTTTANRLRLDRVLVNSVSEEAGSTTTVTPATLWAYPDRQLTAMAIDISGNLSGSVGSVIGNVGGNVAGSVGSIATGGIAAASFASGAIDASAIAANAITDAKVANDVTIASVTGAVGSVAGNVGGNVNGNVVGSVTMPHIDGLDYETWGAAVLAAIGGVASVSGGTVTFKRNDGTTSVLAVTVGSTPGTRTASVIS